MNVSTTLTTGTTTATVTTGPQKRRDPFDLLGLAVLNIGWYLIIGAGVAVHWMILFPPISVPIALTITAGVLVGWPSGASVGVAFTALILLWRKACPDMFDRWVTDRARTRFLTWWRYRRNWFRLMKACRLGMTYETGTATPKLLAVEIGTGTDVVLVQMLEGQSPADYEMRVETLAHAFKADQCHARIHGPGVFELWFRFGEPRTDTVLMPRVDQWTKPEGHTA